MADNRFRSKIVTEFLVDTCLQSKLDLDDIRPLMIWSGFGATIDLNERATILLTGSVAEFYIKPMLSCVGDIDLMCHTNNMLAVPEGTATLTYLPAEFHNFVHVLDIVDSEFPGYVYLALSYTLTESTDEGIYNAEQYSRSSPRRYMPHPDTSRVCLHHGPAFVHAFPEVHFGLPFVRRVSRSNLTMDWVICVRCLSWPPQAADWPTRHRNYDWPDSATVDLVVNNGCDVVQVAHRQCRQHEWMGEHQHRLSFSRAEIVLINSWMPVQQIVYHMLRR